MILVLASAAHAETLLLARGTNSYQVAIIVGATLASWDSIILEGRLSIVLRLHEASTALTAN